MLFSNTCIGPKENLLLEKRLEWVEKGRNKSMERVGECMRQLNVTFAVIIL